jgi:hypothetical protein
VAWGDRRLTKEELKEAGLDTEVVAGMKTTLDGMDDKIKNAVTEANKINTATLEELKNSMATLAGKFAAAGNKGNDNKGNDDKGNDDNQDEAPDWLMDPEKAANALVDKKVGGVAVLAANMRADMNYATFKSTSPRGFLKFENDIREMWSKESLASRCNPKLIENIYKIVIADHVDEIAKTGETFFLEPPSSGTRGSTDQPKKKAEEILTKDELDLAAKWGVTPEDYLKEREGIKGVQYVT